jgi:chromosome segregation ATPase
MILFTPDLGPRLNAWEGMIGMAEEQSGARKLRKMRVSRDGWKERAVKKQNEIKRLRCTVRDLMASREQWKTRTSELEQEVEALQQADASTSCTLCFFGG